jgi:hypothetical protein
MPPIPHQIYHAILSHATSHMPSVIRSPSWNLHHYQHDIFYDISPLSYHIYHVILLYHAISHMPYLIPYPSWHINNYQHAINPMPCLPCQNISDVPYYTTPHFTCHLSYHLHHGISIITNMLYLTSHMPYLTSHAIYMSFHILPCYFSHDLYHIIYLLFHIFCDTSLVPYVPALFLRSCLSCAISCDTSPVSYLWCHICLY